MDKERYVVVEVPDGSLHVGFDETTEPSNPIEDADSTIEQRRYTVVMYFNKWCIYFTNVNAFILLIALFSQNYISGILNIFCGYYSAVIINTRINLQRYHRIHGYLPFFLSSFYTATMTVYFMINSMWLLSAYYFSWYVMSLMTIISTGFVIEEIRDQ
jgi:hypothetical protein